jgi:hypothetical protein
MAESPMSGCRWFDQSSIVISFLLLLTGRLRIRDCRSSMPPRRINRAVAAGDDDVNYHIIVTEATLLSLPSVPQRTST